MNKQLLTTLFALLMCMMCAMGMMAQANASGPSTVSAPISEETVNEDSLYIVLIDQFGNEVPVKLEIDDDDMYTTTFTFQYYPWGEFVWDPSLSDEENEANRPNVPFYFIIDGVRYGADVDMPVTQDYPLLNPLVADGQGNYCVPVGYSYTLGAFFKDGQYYVFATSNYSGYHGGYMIAIDQYGQKHEYKLLRPESDPWDLNITCSFVHEPWGEFTWNPDLSDEENEANRPNVPFYFYIDGIRYGAGDDMQETVLGETNGSQNPLIRKASGYYYLPVGGNYTIWVYEAYRNFYFYVTQTTGIDEITNEKTISSMRYFNLEGQEVTEPDNVTIVVTTYDDGTKSTTKVIK